MNNALISIGLLNEKFEKLAIKVLKLLEKSILIMVKLHAKHPMQKAII